MAAHRPFRSRAVTIAGVGLSALAAVLAMYVLNRSPDPVNAFDPPEGGGAQSQPDPAPAPAPSTLAEAFDQGETPLLRTDFTDDAAWDRVVRLVTTTPDEVGNTAAVVPVSDRHYESMDAAALAGEVMAADLMEGYAILADARSMAEAAAGAEVTVVYVDLSPYAVEDADDFHTFPGRAFRCVVTEVASIEVNLSIANMDFHEFADSVGEDGVFRGF